MVSTSPQTSHVENVSIGAHAENVSANVHGKTASSETESFSGFSTKLEMLTDILTGLKQVVHISNEKVGANRREVSQRMQRTHVENRYNLRSKGNPDSSSQVNKVQVTVDSDNNALSNYRSRLRSAGRSK